MSIFKISISHKCQLSLVQIKRITANIHVRLLNYNLYSDINVREYRRGNQKWTIKRNWQHWVHKTKKNKTNTQHKMFWTPQYVSNHK